MLHTPATREGSVREDHVNALLTFNDSNGYLRIDQPDDGRLFIPRDVRFLARFTAMPRTAPVVSISNVPI